MRGNRGKGRHLRAILASIPAYAGEPARAVQPDPPQPSIPAYAGEPTLRSSTIRLIPVYPRVCGGTDPKVLNYTPHPRLSPRMRGNLGGERVPLVGITSIPAYAGEPLGILIVTPRTIFAKGMAPRRCHHSSRCTPAVSTTAARLFGC